MSKPTLHRSFGSVLTMAASAFIVTSSAHAALVGYENFDGYTAGSAVNGQTGGAGWPTSSAWSAVSGVNVSSEAITYDLGGETLGGGTTVKMTTNSTNALVRAAPVTGGKDVFVSFIFQIKGGTAGTNVTGTVFTGWQADDATPSYTVDSIGYLGNALSIFTKIMPFPVFVESSRLRFPANRQTPVDVDIAFKSAQAHKPTLSGGFNWLEESGEIWTIRFTTGAGKDVRLENGGRKLTVDGELVLEHGDAEYGAMYERFADLLEARQSDVDAAPLRLMADVFLLGARENGPEFEW